MRRSLSWWTFLALLVLGACRDDAPRDRAVENLAPCGDYAVYRLAIDSLILRLAIDSMRLLGRPDSLLFVITPTIGSVPVMVGVNEDPAIPESMRAVFVERNEAPCTLNADSLALDSSLAVMSTASLLTPDANVVEVSRVGFNADSSQAVLFLNHRCGGMCGTGWLVELRRDPAHAWRIVSTRIQWIA